MKPTLFFSVIFFVLSLWGSSVSADSANTESWVSIKQPPASLEQWYKPANKRQVWLHTMFKLRREMQAISVAANNHDKAAMKKWISRLDRDYNKIAEMVPEWEEGIKPRLLTELEMFADKDDTYRLHKTLKMIKRTCDDCHTYFQPLVTATYRSPYYDDIKLKSVDGETLSFDKNMERLSEFVNLTLIALDDGKNEVALQASKDLKQELTVLGESCESCHKDDDYPKERILGKLTAHRLDTLQSNISLGKVKDSQKLMGEIAVTVCARCHNTHRITSDLRNALLPDD